ncbi:MAG: SPASM domain-containing protein [Pyrinomonadaceae bacterium]
MAIELDELRREFKDKAQSEYSVQPESSGGESVSSAQQVKILSTQQPAVNTTQTEIAHSTSSAEYLVSEVKRHQKGVFLALIGVTVVIAAGIGLYKFVNRSGSTPPAPFQAMKIIKLTSNGKAMQAVISPDGKQVVYVVDNGGRRSLWLRQVATATDVQLAAPEDISYEGLTISRDGDFLYYGYEASHPVLYQMPVLGGNPRKVVEDVGSQISFSPDGKQIAFVRSGGQGETALMIANADGTEERKIAIRQRKLKMPLPLVVMSSVVCEWTTDVIEKSYDIARDLGAFILNFNLRYFMPEAAGVAYEKHLQEEFGLKSSGAWRGWVIPGHDKQDYRETADRVRRMLRRKRFRLLPPYVVSGPSKLRGKDFDNWFTDYLNTFGNESCFMPFYWARIHANGDLIFCPGHPDVIAGNGFRDGFMESFNSEMAVKFRKHILRNRLPICNRCCGLYMTNPARPFEQKARRNLGLSKQVATHWP